MRQEDIILRDALLTCTGSCGRSTVFRSLTAVSLLHDPGEQISLGSLASHDVSKCLYCAL